MTSNFISSLALHIKKNYDLRKEELTVVFPNKRAAFYLRTKFQEVFHEEIWLPQMLSIEEAMTQWSGIQLVDTVDMLFELISIDSEIYGNGNNIGMFGSMATKMAKDFDEIDQYGVDAKHLFSYVYEAKTISVWNPSGNLTTKEKQHLDFFRNLERYYDCLRQRLEEQGKGYYGMITRQLASLDDAELLNRINHRKVLFAGFNALTPTEQTVIDKLYRNGYAEVVWDFDRYYVEDENNEAGLFARSYIAKQRPWKPIVSPDSPLLTQTKEIHFVEANGNTLQTKALQSLLQVEDAVDPTIILADEELLVPMLNSIPDEARYASIKVSMGYPLRQTSLHHLIVSFFTLHQKGRKVKDKGWYIWPILRIFDLELIQVIFASQEINQLKAYRIYIAEKSAFVFNSDDFEHYCTSPNLRHFMKLLLNEQADHPSGLLDALVALLAFISNMVQQTTPESTSNFLLNQISEAGKSVNRLHDILNRYQNYLSSIEELLALFRLVSSNTRIKLKNSSTDGLQIMGLLEARNLDFKTFYMLGVNDGILPSDSSHNSFIPYFIRKDCGLPDEQEKQAVYAYHFYRLLQGAEKAYFIYNSNGNNSNGGEPSRFLLQLKHELAQRNPNIKIIKEVFSAPDTNYSPPERIVIHKTKALMDMLMQKIQTSELNKALAPTSISTFIKCPLQFCMHYLFKIRDNSIDENTPDNVIGSVVHNTLQLLYEDYAGTLITPELFTNVIEPSFEEKQTQAITEQFAQGLPDVGYNYLNKNTIKKLFDNYFSFEKTAIAKHQLRILALEHTLHTTILVNGISCTIAGKADRIDQYDGKVRIIDYKTGKVKDSDVTVPKGIATVADIPEKALQLLIYKYLYVKEHPQVDPAMVTASLFALRQKQICLDLKVEHEPLNNAFVDTMEVLLNEVLTTMMDPSAHFAQPEDTKNRPCRICEFNGICVSTLAGASLEDDH